MSTLKVSGVVVDYSDEGWNEFKKWLDGTRASLRYVWVDDGDSYEIAAIDMSIYRTCSINKTDAADFEANYKEYLAIEQQTADGKRIVSVWPTEGTRRTIVTHNWCDRTTWYQKSVAVVDAVPTAVVLGTSYSLAHTNVIDTWHGKLWDEDNLGHRVVVKVDGVTKTEQDPHNNVGEFTVNYSAGIVTFTPPVSVAAVVLVSYHYATTSEFTIAPTAGKVLKIRTVETQFSVDVTLNDTVDFTAYGLVDVFAPELMPGVPSGTKIPLSTTRYKTMQDFQAESNGALATIPVIGGAGWRGIPQPIIVFPWDYAAMLNLSAAAGMEIRIKLQHDAPFGGGFATATLYCLSEAE